MGERNSESSAVPKKPPLLKRQTTVAMFTKPPEDDASRLLQKALLDNPYNKLHQKYNPNLVDDDSQDMAAQLKRRRLRARRLTLLAMHGEGSGTPERRPSADEQVLSNPMVHTAASFFLERAQRRRMLSKGSSAASTGGDSSPRTTRLERQSAVTRSSNGAISIAEEDESDAIVAVAQPSRQKVSKAERKSTESEV
ncbi:uncharacterized protein NPIL_128361 [Nephila pilipes]|uniref:Uncharacterized protein n=1 Tax=Nephila pilipes TaxID=299642 RepID=A0A8X6QB42_NEPPI|nr:uncharacterized protein NPIL_128361 [Nephila pilipes]